MTIAHEASSHAPGSAGTSQGSTSVSEAFVGTPAAGKLAVLYATVKPDTASFGSPSDATGRPWTLVGEATGGTGASGVDTGPTRIGVWAKVLVGDESGSVTLTSSGGNSMAAAMSLWTKTAASWDFGVVVSGGDAGHNTTYGGADLALPAWSAALGAGDVVLVAHANDTDTSLGTLTPSFTQSGATFTSPTHRIASRSGTNNDSGCYAFDAAVSTGSANALGFSFTASGSTNECGPYLAVRLRELASGTVLLGQAVEAETAQPITPSSPSTVTVGQAVEAESAQAVAPLVAAAGWTSKVEVAFATDPMAAVPAWTDVTAYAEWPAEIQVGRTDELAEVNPSTLQLRLRNDDGRFTMGNAASPYYPNVKVGKRIRVTETRNGVGYVRFDGHVNGWPQGWLAPGGTAGRADVSATDRGKRLGKPGNLRSMLEQEVLRDAPGAYYPLGEGAEATSAASVTRAVQAPAVLRQQGSGGTLEFGAGIGPGTDGLAAPLFTPASPTNGLFLQADLTKPVGGPGAAGLTLEAWIRTDGAATSRVVAALVDGSGTALMLNVNEFGEAEAAGASSRGAETFAAAWPVDVNDDRTHHLAVTQAISGSTITAKLYVDGLERASTAVAGTGLVAGRYLQIGGWKANPSGYGLFWGTVAHVAATPAALSAARIAEHYAAGATGFAGERTDVRMGRLSDYVGIPAADRAYDAGDGTVGPQSTAGKQALEAKREVAATEAGVLYFNPADGRETFHRRSRRYNRAPDLTIPASQVDAGATFPGDDFGLVNDLAVTRPGGAGGRAYDQASVDAYGLYEDGFEVVAATDGQAQAAADWRVGNYKDPRVRIPNVTVEVAKLERDNPSLIPGVLAATVGTKLRLTGLPASAPASQVDLFVEGWTEVITPFSWQIAWNTSPGDFQTVWQLGVAGFSELGDTTRLAY